MTVEPVIRWRGWLASLPASIRRCRRDRPTRVVCGRQDCDTLGEKSARLEAWAVKIGELVDPPPRKHVKAACPACGVKTVYRQNDVGESVRVPALQLIPDEGCTCLACAHTWPPEHYLLLCKVLGFDAPEGVTL